MGCNNTNSSRIMSNESKTQTKELRYLNILKTKLILTECYFFKKRIPMKKMKKM